MRYINKYRKTICCRRPDKQVFHFMSVSIKYAREPMCVCVVDRHGSGTDIHSTYMAMAYTWIVDVMLGAMQFLLGSGHKTLAMPLRRKKISTLTTITTTATTSIAHSSVCTWLENPTNATSVSLSHSFSRQNAAEVKTCDTKRVYFAHISQEVNKDNNNKLFVYGSWQEETQNVW